MANPRCYAIDTSFAVASPTKTAITLASTTAVRPEIFDMELGFSSAPADNALVVKVQRFTAAGTTTSQAPNPLDPADPASTTVGGVIATVEPTYTAGLILFHLALNQRASQRWIADQRGPLKLPALANNGAGLYAVHASATPNFDPCVWFNE
jgi:hypothetical protein